MSFRPKILSKNTHYNCFVKLLRCIYYFAMNLFVVRFCDCIIVHKFNFKLIYVKNKTAKLEGKFGNERHNNLKTIKGRTA